MIPILIIGILVLSGIGTCTAMSDTTPSSYKQLVNQESKIQKISQIPYMVVHVEEIYGTVDEPEYRPLANVTVMVRNSLFGIYWEYTWTGTTGEDGNTPIIWISSFIKYCVAISKDGYHTYKCKSSKIVSVLGDWAIDVNFTMAQDGSPFIFSQNNPSPQNQQQINKQINQLPQNIILHQQIVNR